MYLIFKSNILSLICSYQLSNYHFELKIYYLFAIYYILNRSENTTLVCIFYVYVLLLCLVKRSVSIIIKAVIIGCIRNWMGKTRCWISWFRLFLKLEFAYCLEFQYGVTDKTILSLNIVGGMIKPINWQNFVYIFSLRANILIAVLRMFLQDHTNDKNPSIL